MSTPEDLCLNQRQWSLPWWHQTDQQAVWAAKFLTVHPVEQQLEFHCPEWTVRTLPKIKNRNNVSVLIEKQMACCDRKKCYVPRGFCLCAVPENIYTLHAEGIVSLRPKYLKNILSLTTICRGGDRGGLEKIHSMGRYMYGYFLELHNSCFIYTAVFSVGFDFKFHYSISNFTIQVGPLLFWGGGS